MKRQTVVGSPPFAHPWPTLRPMAAGRLVLPWLAPKGKVAPVFAKPFREALGRNWG